VGTLIEGRVFSPKLSPTALYGNSTTNLSPNPSVGWGPKITYVVLTLVLFPSLKTTPFSPSFVPL